MGYVSLHTGLTLVKSPQQAPARAIAQPYVILWFASGTVDVQVEELTPASDTTVLTVAQLTDSSMGAPRYLCSVCACACEYA
jgi:transaldolase